MGLVKDTIDFLNDAAFGMIRRNLFSPRFEYNFMGKPIGLYQKSYDIMMHHLYRNIGNREFTYDGYGDAIGELSNPFYNMTHFVPWFLTDEDKNSKSNYLDYVRDVYGATLSVKNLNSRITYGDTFDKDIINDTVFYRTSDDSVRVGAVPTSRLIDGMTINPNSDRFSDTKLGVVSREYAKGNLENAQASNDLKATNRETGKSNYFITFNLPDYFGFNQEAINNSILDKVLGDDGRFESLSPLEFTDGPVYTKNFGHYDDLGAYSGYFNSLGNKSKQYYYANTSERKYYISAFNGIVPGFEKDATDKYTIRYIFNTLQTHSNVMSSAGGGVYVYGEGEKGTAHDFFYGSFNEGTMFSLYTTYGTGLAANDLLKKTNDAFRNEKYNTIISRFHTNSQVDTTDTTQTAISKQYGMSHGRNLLKRNHVGAKTNGYEDPYCRVWTYHHQYKSLQDTIRPFDSEYDADTLYNSYNFSAFTANHLGSDFENGRKRLERYGSLNKNGFVNITPVDCGDENKKVDIRNCMFSIENLAWKDMFSTDNASRETFQSGGLSPEQKGPFGGRIMWFPPYGLSFNEDVSVDWTETKFIGRGEGIYTYTNTTRTGTLNFKILVDHPSIINYWENRNKDNSGSVDDVDSPEQEILRFFAGCDMLVSKPGPVPDASQESVTGDEAIPTPTTECVRFFVFFPNNYSGIDDGYDFAINYIANGLGAGIEKKWTKNSKGICTQSTEAKRYEIPKAPAENGYGGYEVRPGKPISIVKTQTKGDLHIADVKIGNGIACNNGYTSLFAADGGDGDKWWEKKWYYRIDAEYKWQKLKKESYIDSNSFGLNSTAGLKRIAESLKVEVGDAKLIAFTDVYAAFESTGPITSSLESLYDESNVNMLLGLKKNKSIDHIECIGMASNQGHEKLNPKLAHNRAYTIQQWLRSKGLCDDEKITISYEQMGGTDEGINVGDESSFDNKKWRCCEVSIYVKKEESKTLQAAATENVLPGNASMDSSLSQNHELNIVKGDTTNIGISRIPSWKDLSGNKFFDTSEKSDRITDIRLNKMNDGINGLTLNNRESYRNGNVTMNGQFNAVNDFQNQAKNFQPNALAYATNYNRVKSEDNVSVDRMHDNAAKTNQSLNNSEEEKASYDIGETSRDGTGVRYDNEAKFFRMLEKEEPFLHRKISDKIKFFDPAFHSVSPEGFNARLTFLHQCTRQGPTIGASDNYTAENTANNLAFGRPPVCILRIGDFYYTKIVIENFSVNFDPMLWDLNAEGIGVMPMIADITLRFKFIGGSSLAGHISRLQNAVSFNYYANTEVYDNRAELAEYDENGNLTKFAPYNPTK